MVFVYILLEVIMDVNSRKTTLKAEKKYIFLHKIHVYFYIVQTRCIFAIRSIILEPIFFFNIRVTIVQNVTFIECKRRRRLIVIRELISFDYNIFCSLKSSGYHHPDNAIDVQ